jgi:hypothetical protein
MTRTGDTWSIDRARFSPVRNRGKHDLTLQFVTPLSTATDRIEVSLIAGKKKIIATGLLAAGNAPGHTLTISFSNPAWLDDKKRTEEDVAAKGMIAVSAHP